LQIHQKIALIPLNMPTQGGVDAKSKTFGLFFKDKNTNQAFF
jgi:hypothetical protein